jgi:hypothetical protein
MLGNVSKGWAVIDLDTGLFLAKDGWTTVAELALIFPDIDATAQASKDNCMRNAAATLLGDPPVTAGFIWLNNRN